VVAAVSEFWSLLHVIFHEFCASAHNGLVSSRLFFRVSIDLGWMDADQEELILCLLALTSFILKAGVSFHVIKINIFSSLIATMSVHGAPCISFDPDARSCMFRRSWRVTHASLPSHFR
jgi:hypothetical protein